MNYTTRIYGDHGFTTNSVRYPSIEDARAEILATLDRNPALRGGEIMAKGKSVEKILPAHNRAQT